VELLLLMRCSCPHISGLASTSSHRDASIEPDRLRIRLKILALSVAAAQHGFLTYMLHASSRQHKREGGADKFLPVALKFKL